MLQGRLLCVELYDRSRIYVFPLSVNLTLKAFLLRFMRRWVHVTIQLPPSSIGMTREALIH